MKYFAILIFFGIVSSIVPLSSAHASQCIGGITIQESFDNADHVFSGKVISINSLENYVEQNNNTFPLDDNGEPIEPEQSSLTQTEVTLQVFDSWKGDISDQIIVKPFDVMPPVGFRFIKGESYLVFAENLPWSKYPVVTGCSETKPLSKASDTIRVVEQLTNLNSQSGKDIEVNYKDFRDTSREIICESYSTGGGFLQLPKCGAYSQFVVPVLLIVFLIAGIIVIYVVIRRKRK